MSGANQRATVTRIKSRELIERERLLAQLLAEPVPTDSEIRWIYDWVCCRIQQSVDDMRHADLRKFGFVLDASSADPEVTP